MDGDDDSNSSTHSCELDLKQIGEGPGQIKRWQKTESKMKKLQVPEPTLKLVKDFCFMGIVKAG